MKHVLAGAAVAALVVVTLSGSAEARMHRHHGWHHGIHYSWSYGWCCGPYTWGPAHAASDFVANQMNRREVGLIGYNGALGMDQIMLNPQPLPPRQ